MRSHAATRGSESGRFRPSAYSIGDWACAASHFTASSSVTNGYVERKKKILARSAHFDWDSAADICGMALCA